jgi:hypothetical protein
VKLYIKDRPIVKAKLEVEVRFMCCVLSLRSFSASFSIQTSRRFKAAGCMADDLQCSWKTLA